MTYIVNVTRDEAGYWIAEALEVPGAHTFAKRLDQVPPRIAEAISLYTDEEPEVLGTAPGDGWHCVYEVRDELRAIPVLCFAQLDNDKMYPVIPPRDGSAVDLTVDASADSRFRGLIKPREGLDVPWTTRADIKELLSQQTIEEEE